MNIYNKFGLLIILISLTTGEGSGWIGLVSLIIGIIFFLIPQFQNKATNQLTK